jgi:cellulose synthase operon protein C
MSDADPSLWPPGGDAAPAGADSIAGELASRIDAVPPAPGDAIGWASVAARYEREATALGDHPAAAELLFEAGRIYSERLADDVAALDFHRRAWAAAPSFLPNLRALRRLALDRGDDALAAEVLEGEAAATPDPGAAADLHLLQSRLLSGLGKASDARDALARAVELAPERFGVAEEALREVTAGDAPALAAAYERCARAAGDGVLAAGYLAAASAILEAAGDAPRAAELAFEAHGLAPADPIARAAARRHAERLGRTELLATVLRQEAAGLGGADAAVAFVELARVLERLSDAPGALAALEQARAADPESPAPIADLARLREARGEWEEASAALEALARAHLARRGEGHVLETVAARLRQAEIEDERLGRTDEAIRCCREVLALEPGHRAALSTLGRLSARAGDWPGLLAAFEAEATAARDGHERAQRTFKAAEVLDERLGRPADAAARYREALSLDPDLLCARAALERLLTREGRWDALCALLEGDLERIAAAPERAAHLFRIARVREERLADLDGAAALYRRALELDPESRIVLAALASLLERLDRHAELAEVVLAESRLATDARRRVALLQRRAELLDEHLGDPEAAAAAWDEVRRALPGHLPALRALGRLHARAGRWDAVAELWRADADAASDPEQGADMLFRTAELLERRLARADDALAAYREVLTLAPAHLPALLALARLHRARGDDESLVDVLRAQAAARGPGPERAAALVDAARLCEERLRDASRAVECYEEALRAEPRNVAALRALERLHADAGRSADHDAIRRAAAELPGAGRAELLFRLALRDGDPADARSAACALAEAAPSAPAVALAALRWASEPAQRADARAALAATAGTPGPAAALLAAAALDRRPAAARREALARAAALDPASPALWPDAERRLRAGGADAELARFFETRQAEAADVPSRVSWAVRAGEAWERAGDPGRALASFQAALAAAPHHLPALRAARGLLAASGDWGAVRATLQAEGAALQDVHEAAAAWLEAGLVAEERFADLDGAAEDGRHAAERDPPNPAVLARLEELVARRGGGDLASLHEARARAAREPADAADAWTAAARAAQQAGRRDEALEALDAALEAAPGHAAALQLRARLRAEAGRPADAVVDAEACLALGGEAPVRIPLHLLAAGLCQDLLGEAARALGHLEAVLALAPDHGEALERLARLLLAERRHAEAAAALRRLAALPGLPQRDALRHLAALAEAEAAQGGDAAAASTCRRILEVEPGHARALQLLVEIERRRGDPQQLAAALEAAAEAADPAAAPDLHLDAARLHAGPLASRARAVEHLRAALAADPGRDDVRALLAETCEDSAPSLAVDCHRELLARDAVRVASWAALYRVFDRARAHDRAYVVASVLRWLGAIPPGPSAEKLLLEGDRQALPAPPPLPAADWDTLRDPADRGPLSDLVAAAGDWLVDPPAARRPAAPVREDHPFRKLLGDLARSLGAGEHELVVGPLGALVVEPGAPPVVRVGADLARRTTVREQRFLLGRAAARLRARSAVADALTDAALGERVAAAVWLVVPGYAGTGRPAEELVRRLGKALPRRVRKALEEPARALAQLRPAPDLAAWRVAAAATADRAGLVLCGDVPTAVGLLLRDGPPAPEGADLADRLRARPDALALLAFAATDAHFALRQRLRAAIA